MSGKLSINLSYKNACILKHALRDKLKNEEEIIQTIKKAVADGNKIADKEHWNKWLKEFEEGKRALEAVTKEIDWYKEKYGF